MAPFKDIMIELLGWSVFYCIKLNFHYDYTI